MVSAALAAACRIVCSAARDKWFHTPMKVSSVERSFRSAGERRCRIFGAAITDSLHSEIPLTEDQHVTRSRAGRPAHVPTDETRNLVESLSGFGIPQDEIARLVGIDPKTLRFHYADQIEMGSIKATAKVAQNLFTMACKPTREGLSAAIFWLKVRAGWSEYAPKRVEESLGKKEAAERDALTAGSGNEWGQLVN
jgi:hypothetical protein